MQLLDGKRGSAKIKEDIKRDAAAFLASAGRRPHLVAILVGNDGASETYVASKMRNCELVGFESTNIHYDESITEAELIAKVEELNARSEEHTSELQSLMRISYAVFCLKKKKQQPRRTKMRATQHNHSNNKQNTTIYERNI